MQLSRLSIALRPRGDWSAIDLGFSIAQHWYWGMFWRGAILLLPILGVAIALNNVILGVLLIWWFKPLYERIPLRYLSSAVFDESIPWRDSLRGCFDRQLFLSLTFFRLSMRRTSYASISLEKLDKTHISYRKVTLFRSLSMAILWLAMVGVVFEIASSIFIYQLLDSFFETARQVVTKADPSTLGKITVYVNDLFASLRSMSLVELSAFLTIYAAIVLAVLPFYISASFSLYINQRTKIEGWDIEVGFNKLMQRLGFLSLALCLTFPIDLQAQNPVDHETAITEVKNSEDFNHVRSTELPDDLASFLEWLNQALKTSPGQVEARQASPIAPFLEILLWIVFACLIGYFLVQLLLLLPNIQTAKQAEKQTGSRNRVTSTMLAKLPRNILYSAQQAWNSEDPRRAYSLLYLGSIRYLRDEYACQIGQEETEGECLRRISHLETHICDAFLEILASWQRVAYQGVVIQEPQFSRALQTFGQHFAPK